MCWGELAEVLAVTGPASGPVAAVVRRDGRATSTVSLLAVGEPVVAGDWLLVHSGFALHRLTPEQARDAAALRAGGDAPADPTTTDGRGDVP